MAALDGLYGEPPAELAAAPAGAVQLSPLHPGAEALEAMADGALSSLTMLAPPGAAERRYALAQALRAIGPGGRLTALAPKDRGGARLGKDLAAFGCDVAETARRHHRICTVARPETPVGLEAALAEGGPRFVEAIGLWSQPGVFSWDRIDPGSDLLAAALPSLAGEGADFGGGVGFLALSVLKSPKVSRLHVLDIDRRAVETARRNIDDPRAEIRWADVRTDAPANLDFVVMNPPFHANGLENHGLGQVFIRTAATALRKGGTLWMVANRHLPYEAALSTLFSRVTPMKDAGGYKVLEARR